MDRWIIATIICVVAAVAVAVFIAVVEEIKYRKALRDIAEVRRGY